MQTFTEFIQRHDSKRGHFLDYWRSLRPDTPIYMEPVAKDHHGSSRAEDQVRISGSSAFVASILVRLKELLAFEGDKIKLEVDFHQSSYTKERTGEPVYILYIKTKVR